MSVVRHNLLNDPNYTPYCGDDRCRVMPRLVFDGKQFRCTDCGFVTAFEPEFIKQVIEFREQAKRKQQEEVKP